MSEPWHCVNIINRIPIPFTLQMGDTEADEAVGGQKVGGWDPDIPQSLPKMHSEAQLGHTTAGTGTGTFVILNHYRTLNVVCLDEF